MIPAPTGTAEQVIRHQVENLNSLHDGLNHFAEVVAVGSAAIPALEELLRSRSVSVPQPRLLAADAIAAIGGRTAADALLRALEDSAARSLPPVLEEAEVSVVDRIAGHLGRIRDARSADVLLAALRRHRYPGCAAALGELRDERAIPLLASCLADDYARAAAIPALRRFGTRAIAALTRTLEAANSATSQNAAVEIGRAAAVALLGKIGGRFVHQPLLRALTDRNRHVRLAAALALAPVIGPDRDRAIQVLIGLLDDEDWRRIDIIEDALQSMGITAMRALACAIATPAVGIEGARRRARAESLLQRIRKQRQAELQ